MKSYAAAAAAAASAVAFLIAAAPAPASQVYAGQPKGQTGFQLVLTLANSGKQVTGLTFHADVSCPTDFRSVDFGSALVVDDIPGSLQSGAHYLVSPKISGKKFTGTLVGIDIFGDTIESMNATLNGTISSGKASGQVALKFVDSSLETGALTAQCSKTIAWKALRNPGIVYGGRTSQDEPVVVELSANRKQFNHAHLSWWGDCQVSGAWTDPHDEFDLNPIGLSRSGAFSRTYRFNLGQASFIVERFAGKVGAKSASGTFRGDVTVGGDAPDTCSSGAVSWKAATG